MKINELRKPPEVDALKKDVSHVKKVDSRDQSWMETLPKHLEKHGFYPIGSGKYATVFGNDKYPFVLKIFMRDAAFLRWYKFCRENQGNPFIPKLRGKLVKITNMIFAIRMEKLESFSHHSMNNNRINKLLLTIIDNEEYEKRTGNKFIDDILNEISKNKDLLDIHYENIMLDKNGQLKLTDIFYNWFDTNTMKHKVDPDDISFYD